VAPTATGLVGVAGIAGTYLSSGRQQKTALKLAREQRLSEAYLDLLRAVEREGQWAEYRCKRLVDATYDPLERTTPDIAKPELTERARIAALVGAFSSMLIFRCYRGWLNSIEAIDNELIVLEYDWHQNYAGPDTTIDYADIQKLVEVLQPIEVESRTALAEAVAHELGSRT
jgi:hypothetical protein